MKKFSVEKFTIHWSCVHNKEDINLAFKKFLKEEMNSDPFDCVELINKMKSQTVKEQNESFVKILDQYVQKDAKNQVNISGKDQDVLLKLYDTAKQGKLENPYNDLNDLRNILESELYLDNFPRFIRCKDYLSLFQKYKDDKTVMNPHISIRYPYSDEQFNKIIPTESDFDFMFELSKDSFEWDHIHGTKNFNVYYSDLDFLPNSKFFKGSVCVKADGIAPYNFNKILTSLNYERLNDLFGLKRTGKTTKFYSVEELKKMYPDNNILGPCIDIDDIFTFPFPLNTPRRLKISITMVYSEKENSFLILIKPSLWNIDYLNIKDIDWSQKNPIKDGFEGYFVPTMHFIKVKKISENISHVNHIKSKFITLILSF